MFRKLFFLSVFFFTAVNLYSQNYYDVKGLSMGNTTATNSTDVDAFNQNPANLANQKWGSNSTYYFNIVTNGGMFFSSKFLSFNFYDSYFKPDANGNLPVLSQQDKDLILQEASNQPASALVSVKVAALVVNTKRIGSFGISLDERFTTNFRASRDFLDLGLFGNVSNTTYDLSQSRVNAYWIRQLNLSYAKKLDMKSNRTFASISLGASVKPQFGLYYLKTTQSDLKVTTNGLNQITGTGSTEIVYAGLNDQNEFKYGLDNSGFGLGFDAGVNVELKGISKTGKMNIGLSIVDLGYLNWTKFTNKYFNNGNFVITNISSQQQIDSLIDQIKGTATPIQDFSVSLPTTVRLGASYRIMSNAKSDSLRKEIATIAVDYIQGLNDEMGNVKQGMVGLGIEYNISKVVSPRIGFSIGGTQDFQFGLGIGINPGPVIIDLGTYNVESIFKPASTTKFAAGLSIKFKVN